jgi:hypothetical protein
MPRCTNNPNTFVAGALPTITIDNKSYYVDGRLKQLRNVHDFMDSVSCIVDDVWDSLSQQDRAIVCYEFMGERI